MTSTRLTARRCGATVQRVPVGPVARPYIVALIGAAGASYCQYGLGDLSHSVFTYVARVLPNPNTEHSVRSAKVRWYRDREHPTGVGVQSAGCSGIKAPPSPPRC